MTNIIFDFTKMASPLPHFAHLLPPTYKQLVLQWVADDAPSFDIGGLVVGEEPVEAHLLLKGAPRGGAPGGGAVLAGAPFFTALFEGLGCTVEWDAREGEALAPPRAVAVVRGPARAVLLGERTALNILARASGVATAARGLAGLGAAAGWHGEVAGSRKVTPGAFRLVEKYALLVGGASTHRMDLSQMVMLKGACARAAAAAAAAATTTTAAAACLSGRGRMAPPGTPTRHAALKHASPPHTHPPHPRAPLAPQTTTCGRRAPSRRPWPPRSARRGSASRWRWRRGGWRRRWRPRPRARTL